MLFHPSVVAGRDVSRKRNTREGRTEKISRMRSDPASSTVIGGWERMRVDQVSWKNRRLMVVEMEVLDCRRSRGRMGRESRVESIVFPFARLIPQLLNQCWYFQQFGS